MEYSLIIVSNDIFPFSALVLLLNTILIRIPKITEIHFLEARKVKLPMFPASMSLDFNSHQTMFLSMLMLNNTMNQTNALNLKEAHELFILFIYYLKRHLNFLFYLFIY